MEETTVKKASIEQSLVDFKMVTFTLAGKDYGIDIMKVKEISKESKFTFVPNAAPFVRGVYNLRGDIISVIDLRLFFNIAMDNESEQMMDLIILRLDDNVIAVVVDAVDSVVGISSKSIQPSHPLFGDINIKYINGVVENDGRLYVILDVERILGTDNSTEQKSNPTLQKPLPDAPTAAASADVELGFIEETLATFSSFHASPVNQNWIRQRFEAWKEQRKDTLQLENGKDADSFLQPFFSPHNASFWDSDYSKKISFFLPPTPKGNFSVWNPGCGNGCESYSVACMIKDAFPSVPLKVIANDNDLIRISTAPDLIVGKNEEVDKPIRDYLVENDRGRQFKKEISDSIRFEYHNIANVSQLQDIDMVVMRDTVSFLSVSEQEHIFTTLDDALKEGGILILGSHEEPMNLDAWEKIEHSGVVAYKKR